MRLMAAVGTLGEIFEGDAARAVRRDRSGLSVGS